MDDDRRETNDQPRAHQLKVLATKSIAQQTVAAPDDLEPQDTSRIPIQAKTYHHIVAQGSSRNHFGDVYQICPSPETHTIRSHGLCLGTAPCIDAEGFVGRNGELSHMVQKLRPHEQGNEQRRYIVGGMGGIGKTQLAIAYARHNHASYRSTFWLDATTEDTLKQAFRSVAREVLDPDINDGSKNEVVVQHVIRWLSHRNNNRWLIIMDNYDDPDLYRIDHYLPNTAHGTIIITTRLAERVTGQQMPQLRLNPLEDLNESLAILENRSCREGVKADPDARRLAERLAGLPLALATAGSYLRRTISTFAEYLEAYEKRFNVSRRRSVQLPEYSDRTLHTTWNISFTRLQDDDPDAARLLQTLAYFDNQKLWYELLSAGLNEHSPKWLRDIMSSRDDFMEVMGTLVDYCLVDAHASHGSYSVHNCIHDWALAELNEKVVPELYWHVVHSIANTVRQVPNEKLQKALHAPLARHALRCTHGHFQAWLSTQTLTPERSEALLKLEALLVMQNHFSAANMIYRQMGWANQHSRQPESINIEHTLGAIGHIRMMAVDPREAEERRRGALLKIREEKPVCLCTELNLAAACEVVVIKKGYRYLNDADKLALRALEAYERRGYDIASLSQTKLYDCATMLLLICYGASTHSTRFTTLRHLLELVGDKWRRDRRLASQLGYAMVYCDELERAQIAFSYQVLERSGEETELGASCCCCGWDLTAGMGWLICRQCFCASLCRNCFTLCKKGGADTSHTYFTFDTDKIEASRSVSDNWFSAVDLVAKVGDNVSCADSADCDDLFPGAN